MSILVAILLAQAGGLFVPPPVCRPTPQDQAANMSVYEWPQSSICIGMANGLTSCSPCGTDIPDAGGCCHPGTCGSLGWECGSGDTGCGTDTGSCGTCTAYPGHSYCSELHACECGTYHQCSDYGWNCGYVDTGCGFYYACGTCSTSGGWANNHCPVDYPYGGNCECDVTPNAACGESDGCGGEGTWCDTSGGWANRYCNVDGNCACEPTPDEACGVSDGCGGYGTWCDTSGGWANNTCVAGSCSCTPTPAAACGASDGCGGFGTYCDTSGGWDNRTCVSGVCSCTPDSCATNCPTYECGTCPDHCGSSASCGTCTSPDVCYPTHDCCTPQTCETHNFQCGSNHDDVCGGTYNCGPCNPGDTCGNEPYFQCSCVALNCEYYCNEQSCTGSDCTGDPATCTCYGCP